MHYQLLTLYTENPSKFNMRQSATNPPSSDQFENEISDTYKEDTHDLAPNSSSGDVWVLHENGRHQYEVQIENSYQRTESLTTCCSEKDYSISKTSDSETESVSSIECWNAY